MMIDFADEYGVLSLNALKNSTDEGSHVLQGNYPGDWISDSAATLPHVSVTSFEKKNGSEVSARKSILGILEKLSCYSNR